jgi:hypothetical protein
MTTRSIKTIMPQLEVTLQMPGTMIYERQRALVKAGLVETRPGRGPGSGVEASPKNLALLLLAIMASEKPMVGAFFARTFAGFLPARITNKRGGYVYTHRCKYTQRGSLLESLIYLLGEEKEDLASIPSLMVSVSRHYAVLLDTMPFEGGPPKRRQLFVPVDWMLSEGIAPAIDTTSTFALRYLAAIFR